MQPVELVPELLDVLGGELASREGHAQLVSLADVAAVGGVDDLHAVVWHSVPLELGQGLEGRVPHALVALHPVGGAGGLALLVDVGGVDGKDLGGVAVLGPGLGGPVLGQLAELVAVGPGDAPLLGDALRTFELGGELVVLPVALVDGLAEGLVPGGGPHRDLAHDLHAAGHGGVDDAGGDEGVGQADGLLGGAALGVDGGGRDLDGQPGGQPGIPGDVHGLHADLGDAAADDLADLERVDASADEQVALDGAQQVDGVHGGQPAVAAPDRRPHGLDDHDIPHGGSLR